jgi:hypothetical protein
VKNYIAYLDESYLIITLNKFSFKQVEIEKSPKKIYAIDTGLINSIAMKFSANIGRLYETIVAVELKRKQALERDANMEIYYYKNPQNYEVDFIIKRDLKFSQLVQVCYNIKDTGTKDREIRSLIHAARDLKCDNLLVITGDFEGVEEIEWFGLKGRVVFLPLWKWLLENK